MAAPVTWVARPEAQRATRGRKVPKATKKKRIGQHFPSLKLLGVCVCVCVLYVKGWLRWVGRGGGAGGEAADLGAMFSQRCRCFGRQMAPNRNSLSAARSTRQKSRRRDDVRFPPARPTPFSEGFFLPTLARWRWRPNQNTLLRTVTHLETRSQRPLQRCRTLQIHFLVFLFQF